MPAVDPRRGRSAPVAFWTVGAVFATAMAFSTVPAPLYAFYQRRDGFSTFTVTVVFAAYAVGVLASLFLVGHVSDRWGRRPLLAAALVAECLAAVVFLLWPEVPGLILARVVTGVGVGMVTATASAALAELGGARRERSERVAVAANLGGLALGPPVAGALAQFAPAPLVLPHALFLLLMLAGLVSLRSVPETVDRGAGAGWRYRPQRVAVPAAGRARFATVAVGSFAAFSVLGLFTSVAPGFVADTLHHSSPLLGGLVTFAVLAAAAGAQVVFGRLPAPRQVRFGLLLLAAGTLVVTAAVRGGGLAPFVAGGVVAGSGVGLLFKGALSTVAGLARPEARGEALAGLFLAAYLGLVVPVVGIGVATLAVPLSTALLGFAAGVLVVLAGVACARTAHPGDPS